MAAGKTVYGKVDRSKKAPKVTDDRPSQDSGRFPLRGDFKLGSGMAEVARKRLKSRKKQIDKASSY